MRKDETTNDKDKKLNISDYPAIISAIRSPLSFFGLTILICNAVFALAAASMNDIDAFKYAIHTFLSIIGAFIAIAIWCPKSLYHPRELQGLNSELTDDIIPRIVVTIVLLFIMFSYMGYQIYQNEPSLSKTQTEALQKEPPNKAN